MLSILVMGVVNISRQFFTTLVGMGSRSHDFDDELKISFLISSSFARSKTFILDLISGFSTDGIMCTLSGNLERVVTILSKKYLEKWSQSHFTDVNSGRAGGGIPCRMLVIEFHKRQGLSEFSEIASAKYFDVAFVINLLHSGISWGIHEVGGFLGSRVFVLTGAYLSKIEQRTESYGWQSAESSLFGFFIRSEFRISEWSDS